MHAEVARELDRAENEGRPGITVVVDLQQDAAGEQQQQQHEQHQKQPGEAVDFGEIRFLRKKTCSLTIANTGRVPASFSFVEKPTTEEIDEVDLPQWLTTAFTRPDAGADDGEMIDLGKEVTLEPGETVNSLVEVLVDDLAHVRMLNDGQAVLEDVLVLRVGGG